MERSGPVKIGVILHRLDTHAVPTLRFLITRMNALQRSIEFELLSVPESVSPELFGTLTSALSDGIVARGALRPALRALHDEIASYLDEAAAEFGLAQRSLPDRVVVGCSVKFDDNFYSLRQGPSTVIALGNWERHMAPPSLVEFFLTLLLREVGATATAQLSGSVHYGTRGCVFDLTPDLSDARYKVLTGFICAECVAALADEQLATDLEMLLSRRWIGRRDKPGSPAHVAAMLGHDLSITKSLRPTFVESVRSTFRDELVKTATAFVGAVALAAAVVLLGLK